MEAVPGSVWTQFVLYWSKQDGSSVKWGQSPVGGSSDGKKWKQSECESWWMNIGSRRIDSTFAGYTGPSGKVEYRVRDELTTFGRSGSVTFISKTGNSYVVENTAVQQQPVQRVDKISMSGFKFGTWYWNAQQVKAFADANSYPVVVEYSSR